MDKLQSLTRSDLNFFINQNVQVDLQNFTKNCILELKYSTYLDKFIRKKLKNITLRLSKNSKFVNSAFDVPSFNS